MVARDALEDREVTLPDSNLALNSSLRVLRVSFLMLRCCTYNGELGKALKLNFKRMAREALRKKKVIIWELFPTWGGVSSTFCHPNNNLKYTLKTP